MKKVALSLSILLVLLLVGCGGKGANNYYTVVDDMVDEYEEYLYYKAQYKEGITNGSMTKDDEEDLERKIALEQADALNLVRDIEAAYKDLSDAEKENLLDYIKNNKDEKYGAFADWLTKTGTTYQDLIEGIEGENY